MLHTPIKGAIVGVVYPYTVCATVGATAGAISRITSAASGTDSEETRATVRYTISRGGAIEGVPIKKKK